jgi:putative aldouronate transport system permease protein
MQAAAHNRPLYKRIKPFDIFNGLVMILLCFVTLYPLWYCIVASFSDGGMLMQGKVTFWPMGANIEAYRILFQYKMIPRAYLNTFIYVVVGILLSLTLTLLAAFPLTRPEFRMRRPMSFFIAFTMLFNGGMVPTYIVVQSLGIVDTPFAFILPIALNAYNIIVLRTFIQTIPEEIIEASKIDGCGYFRIFTAIVIPHSLIGIITVGMFYLVTYWNSFMPGVLYVMVKQELLPMQNILRKIVISEESISEATVGNAQMAKSVQYAAIVITAVPLLFVYPFLQKYFEKGVMFGGVKG